MSNEKQQTAVEWLISQLHKTRDWQRVINEANESSSSVRDIIEQAKEMEKERMLECYLKADVFPRKYEFEKWYNETYGGNK